MPAILTIARLFFIDKNGRQKAIDAFHDIIEFTTPNEPEVLQYVCALPMDDSLGTEIYMIEEYTNHEAQDMHLATKPVQNLLQLFSTDDILAQPPEVHNCPFVAKKTFGSPLPISSTPAIVLLNYPSKSGSAIQSAGKWEEIAEISISKDQGISNLAVVEDKDANSIRVQCVARDWNAFADFQASVLDCSAGDVEMVKIKPIDGFLSRQGRHDMCKLQVCIKL
ncbi:hypothetical protein PtrSN002B_010992 [Pyrenophora tritici-repentis]|uniref:Uncharacterized protein n=1 Tax=Pyrenophora tritici-repentis TaxID=45151 RepID=A0A2W1CXV1_9PLEO|nr:hypothetical protein PtrV1_05991 [Pyrenophora tritici-repentis]KAF7450732.1 hypothetical protein A1F99_053480 [Pyrenophora tritici-repentis]KAF7573373.1 hypothetical protein PtrM4_082780 [Pyrenophora tritici-repentis]KAG9381053.1 hypothetical protein A1F94_008373 [Pyrenophora tritici-repentis]KAI0570247.1 hypothetical protein Alg215_11175 [Pyrenophora tritici-repentis]